MKRNKIFLLLILTILTGCIIPVQNRAPHVKRIDELYLRQNNCSQLGFVEGSESMGNTMSHDKERAIQKATNEAGDLGGNRIMIKNISQNLFNTTVEGVVYSCKESNCSLEEWQKTKKINKIETYTNFQTKCGFRDNKYYKLAEININSLIDQNKIKVNVGKGKAVIVRTGVLGNVRESQLKIIINKFLDEVSSDYDIVPQEEYEKAEEAAFQELNYEEIAKSEDRIYGKNFFTKMIYGSAMEVHFNTMIKFKDSSYKLIINNFRIKDVRYGTVAVETLGKSSQKKWMNFISNQLPLVIANLERENTDEW